MGLGPSCSVKRAGQGETEAAWCPLCVESKKAEFPETESRTVVTRAGGGGRGDVATGHKLHGEDGRALKA